MNDARVRLVQDPQRRLPHIRRMDAQAHADRIRTQFTQQAEPFAAFPIHTQETSLAWLREELHLRGNERVLDAGCGPGLVTRYLAAYAHALVGVDATPAMLTKAREVTAGFEQVSFVEGLMEALPFETGFFDAVVTRYTLHHVIDPEVVVRELVRVCRVGGRVVVCDAAPQPACRDAYDAWERLRDPSHTSARTPDELCALAERHLDQVSLRTFRLPAAVDDLIASSFPAPDDRERLRAATLADVGVNALDMDVRQVNGALMMSFPIVIAAGTVRPR